MDQLQRDAGILPHLRPQLWRQPQAAHGRGPRQQQTPGDTRHLGAQLQGAAAPNASRGWGMVCPRKMAGNHGTSLWKVETAAEKTCIFAGKGGFCHFEKWRAPFIVDILDP